MKCPLPETRTHEHTHTQTRSCSLSPFPYTPINAHINLIHQGYSGYPLFLKHTHMKCSFFYAHMNTHTHRPCPFLRSFSFHTPTSTHPHQHTHINTPTSTHTHQHTPINTHTSTHTQHTHQPDTSGLFGLASFPETRTHEMSFSLRTHEHTRT